ncbi:MAG: 50S ribosomal protein L32 [Legionellales bacterium]|nr:50S ribosomal protein L32 [Legionellales bacterium]|tara:strand:+ start:2122 stop:2307 length:186 start_codon:yes stop_codon:yes gene_type:complete
MAVQKSRVTPSRRGMRRANTKIDNPTLAIDHETGETHRRHHVTQNGYYRGKKILNSVNDNG